MRNLARTERSGKIAFWQCVDLARAFSLPLTLAALAPDGRVAKSTIDKSRRAEPVTVH